MTSFPGFGQEPELSSLSGEQLRARVARAQMYLIEMAPTAQATVSVGSDLHLEHLAYLCQLEQLGVLYAAGPLSFGGATAAEELAIVVAPSRESAEQIARRDPFAKAGVRINSVRSYTINEGVACYVARAMSKRSTSGSDLLGIQVDTPKPSSEELEAKAAGAEVSLVILEPTDKPRPAEDVATMDAHFVWLRQNEMSAKLIGCGPLESERALAPCVWGGGLGIFATSPGEAEAIARAEPSGVAGYRALSVMGWTINYGIVAPIAKALLTLNQLGSAEAAFGQRAK